MDATLAVPHLDPRRHAVACAALLLALVIGEIYGECVIDSGLPRGVSIL